MATKLERLLERPADRAPRITITGEPGVGKTTLACLFPKPVVLRLEDGVESIAADRRPFSFPIAQTFDDALGYVQTLIDEQNPFLTLVVDSVSKLASIIEGEIIASDIRKPKSINQALGGYGAGLNACAERHRMFADKCEQLNALGVTIVYVAHTMIEQVDPPDGDSYSRFSLRMHKNAAAHYIDPVDAVVFIKVKSRYISREDEKRKRLSADSERLLVAHPTGAHISKNRYGIEDPILWDDRTVNPLLQYIPFFVAMKNAKQGASKSRSKQA